jgi:hypothetical protein
MVGIKTLKDLKREILKLVPCEGIWECRQLIDSFEAGLKSEMFRVFDGKQRWSNICPPERRGVEIALIRILLGVSWERANKISFNIATEKELRTILKGDGERR